MAPFGSLDRELDRTAEMLVNIAKHQGVYFVVAMLYDSSYDLERLKKLLPILKEKEGSILHMDKPREEREREWAKGVE